MSMVAERESGLNDPARLRALTASGRQPPIHETLDIALVSAFSGAKPFSRDGERLASVTSSLILMPLEN